MSEDTKIDYSFIIPAFNEEAYLPKTLLRLKHAMKAMGALNGEIVVADNNSTDRTAAIAKEFGARVVFEEHRQIARARNAGAKKALGRYLIFIDSDTIISPVLLKETLTTLESGKYCGGGTIPEFDEDPPFPANIAIRFWAFLSRTFKWACGAYVFCTHEAFAETGGFDERYYASEEIHFSRAMRRWGRKRGKKIIILEEPIITSSRKLVWYNTWEILMMSFGLMLHSSPLRNRKACYKMWYHRPEKPS
jgi:glycosyltransferase involved in cell wall biosynthesis